MSAAAKIDHPHRPSPEDRMNREVVNGIELMSPRPAVRHSVSATRLAMMLSPYDQVMGPPSGPGGWWILLEPELKLQGDDPINPDWAGWRVDRTPALPNTADIRIAPDWVCEVLSPSTEDYDRGEKLLVYAEFGVGHVWLLNPLVRTLEIYRLDGDTYRLLRTYRANAVLRAEPFEGVEVRLPLLWILAV